MYRVHQDSGANQGETPGFGESPSSQPISGLVIFSKRQALSRAVVVNSNMSRGKCLAREGPGSRLRMVIQGSQDVKLATERVQCKAGEFQATALTYLHAFDPHCSTSPVLLYSLGPFGMSEHRLSKQWYRRLREPLCWLNLLNPWDVLLRHGD